MQIICRKYAENMQNNMYKICKEYAEYANSYAENMQYIC